MNTMKKILATSISTAVLASSLVAAPAYAEVEASVAVATAYLWRGKDLGNGDPAVSGDLVYSNSGFYTGIWGSSGDAELGNEFDLFAGYGTEFGDFSVDISVWNYVYPDRTSDSAAFGESNDNFGDLSEIILSLGYGAFSVTYYDNIAGGSGYSYLTVGAEHEQFAATIGTHMNDDDTADFTHLDLSYAFNDNVTFTVSKVIDEADDGSIDEDVNFVISYSLPIK